MKLLATKKQIKNSYSKIISVGYCNIQYLTKYKNPFAYSKSLYGWSCDYYEFNNVCLSTGYSPIGEIVSYNLVTEYELKASKIINDYNISYDLKETKVNELLNEFINNLK